VIICRIPDDRKQELLQPLPDMEQVESFGRRSPPICRKCGVVLNPYERERFGMLCLEHHVRQWAYRMWTRYGRLK